MSPDWSILTRRFPRCYIRFISSSIVDGIVVLVDTTAKGHSLNLQRAAAVINVSPLCDVIPEDLMGFVEKEISCLEFILNKETPRILSRNLNNFCSTGGKNANTLSKAFFDCWQLEADGTDRWYVTRPSLDHQGLKEDHTYIVVGGARGIGLKTVEWMVRRGKLLSAKHCYSANLHWFLLIYQRTNVSCCIGGYLA